jgi:ribosome biogenesis GTPase / thiamine phosphate phosphatase
MRGLVISSPGNQHLVKAENGEMYSCSLKGLFRKKGTGFTNPVVVGDYVRFEKGQEKGTGVIYEIETRKNYIVRASTRKKNKNHIIASNIDQALLITSIKFPNVKPGFIDRFLVTCEAYHIPAIIVFNKEDLLNDKSHERLKEISSIYESIGYKTYSISVKENKGIAGLKELLRGKTSLTAGHSGVGKSSLINTLIPGLNLKVANLSGYTGKGVHTTTKASMFSLPEGGYIIDTPGIKELTIVDIEPEEISHYFPEMKALIHDCQFHNCWHIDEPGCAVKEAFINGKINETRFENYLHIVMDLKESKKW